MQPVPWADDAGWLQLREYDALNDRWRAAPPIASIAADGSRAQPTRRPLEPWPRTGGSPPPARAAGRPATTNAPTGSWIPSPDPAAGDVAAGPQARGSAGHLSTPSASIVVARATADLRTAPITKVRLTRSPELAETLPGVYGHLSTTRIGIKVEIAAFPAALPIPAACLGGALVVDPPKSRPQSWPESQDV